MIQTIENMIHQRLEGLEVSNEKWIDMLGPVLKTNIIIQNIQQLDYHQMKQTRKATILKYG